MDETGKMYSLITAAAVLATVPLVLLFLAGQRFSLKGLTTGGVFSRSESKLENRLTLFYGVKILARIPSF